VAQSLDRELRGLQRAGQRLENASKEWEQAYRLYVAALDKLNRKAAAKNRPEQVARPGEGRQTHSHRLHSAHKNAQAGEGDKVREN
jgi:exonuclease VII small subunit